MDIVAMRKKALKAISPLVPAEIEYFGGHRIVSGLELPDYYLVYFLFVDLLRFKNLGRHEKLAWSVPVDFEGHLMHIEHRKFGLGVFSSGDSTDEEVAASEVVKLIKNGVKVAQPYYDWRAKEAVSSSNISVRNQANYLYDRFQHFLQAYESKCTEIKQTGNDYIKMTHGDGLSFTMRALGPQLERESEWLAHSAIESFFSWTEHVFIQLAILQGKCLTGDEVKAIAGADWKEKFKVALDIHCPNTKRYYDALIIIRNQVRNFVAHGAFGRDGEAFLFHSGVGAVPVKMPHREGNHSYRFRNQLDINQSMSDREAITLIEEFITYLRSGELSPAWIYVDSYMDTVLTFAQDGTYGDAMASEDAMNEFVEYLSYWEDVYINMDF